MNAASGKFKEIGKVDGGIQKYGKKKRKNEKSQNVLL